MFARENHWVSVVREERKGRGKKWEGRGGERGGEESGGGQGRGGREEKRRDGESGRGNRKLGGREPKSQVWPETLWDFPAAFSPLILGNLRAK